MNKRTFMHLVDAFLQSDLANSQKRFRLHIVVVVFFISICSYQFHLNVSCSAGTQLKMCHYCS